jgi:hypothetical protein
MWYRLFGSIPTANAPHASLSARSGFDHVAVHWGAAVGVDFGAAVVAGVGTELGDWVGVGSAAVSSGT